MVQLQNEVTILFRAIDGVTKQVGKITKTMDQVGDVTKVTTKRFDQFGDAISKNVRKIEDHRKRFQFWALSIMFGAMAVERFLTRVFRDMGSAYLKITENTTALGQATLRLQAAFTFFQVAMMEALGPVLIPILENLAV